MLDTSESLRLRVLINFYHSGGNACTVTGLSRTLCEEKYVISRCFMSLEKEGLLDRSDLRHPKLTAEGEREGKRLSERMEIAVHHLLYEGVDIDHARQDAAVWALHNTDQTMNVIRNTDEIYHVKHEIRNKSSFSGKELCTHLKDGTYELPFIIYREQVRNGENISMANDAFDHPCVLKIVDGVGFIQLTALPLFGKSATTGKRMKGRIRSMQYMSSGSFIDVETDGTTFTMPVGDFHFISIGAGVNTVLHGSLCLKMQCSVGPMHMPESMAMFTLML